MYYPTNKDFVYGLAIWNGPIVMFILMLVFYSAALVLGFILSILISTWLWNSTSYKIENGELFAKCLIFRKRVKIENIQKVKKTRNILSSYALSTERLEIMENTQDKFYVSPKNYESFIGELKKYNSNIILE